MSEKQITVNIKYNNDIWAENVTELIKENWNKLISIDSNKHLKKMGFDEYTREINFKLSEINQFNTRTSKTHFVLNWYNNFINSENLPVWLIDDNKEEINIEIIHFSYEQ